MMKSKQFDGLYCIHLELSSLCNKNCWMCGRRKIDRDYPEIKTKYGFMDFELVKTIAKQIPPNIVIQFHNNGEPFLYPRLGDALDLFSNNIKCLDTNGKLLIKKKDEVIDKLDSLTLSVIENDPDADKQYEIAKEFLEIKGDKKPLVVFRLLGDVARYYEGKNYKYNKDRLWRWTRLAKKHDCILATRILHSPMGSHTYTKKPTIPEIGICTELLTHLAIDRFGDVSCCVRFDPQRRGVLGNVNDTPLVDIWNGERRKEIIELHKKGKRKEVPVCDACEFWGVPTGS